MIRACFYGSVICEDVVSSGTAPPQSMVWVGRLTKFLFVRCPSQSLLCDKRVSPVAVTATSAWAAQLVRPQDSLGCCTTSLSASACPAPVLVA